MLSASGISIDGDFSDWVSLPSHTDPVDDQHDTDHDGPLDTPDYVDHPDVDLLEFKVTHDEENFFFYFRSRGEIGRTQVEDLSAGLRAGRYYVIVTIDVDNDDSTGYWLHEGGYYPTTDGYDMNTELEFYSGTINTGHYLQHGANNNTELEQAFADQSNGQYVWGGPETQGPFTPGFVDVLPGHYDYYTQWVYKEDDPGHGGNDSVTFVADKGPVVLGNITLAVSADGHELEMMAPFKGFLVDSVGNPIIELGKTVDLSFSLEASGELSNEVSAQNPNGKWASDTADPIVGYVLTDPTAPIVDLTVPVQTNDTTPEVTVIATDNFGLPDGTVVELDVDLNNDSDFDDAGESAYVTSVLSSGSTIFDISPALMVGNYRLQARVSDQAGNEGSSSVESLEIAAPETLISSSTVGQQRTGSAGQHSVSSAADGRYVATWWSDRGDGSGAGVFAQLYRADGSKVGGPFIVSTTTANDQLNPSVSMRANGQFTIVWQTDSDPGAGVNWEIHAQRYLASGLLDGPEIVVNTESTSNQSLADIVYLNDGSFAVTWTGKGPGDANGVFARVFDPAGNPLGDEFLVNETTTGPQLNPSLTADAAGGFAVVWHGEGAGDTSGVFFRRYQGTGAALTGEVLVNQTTSNVQETASVTQAGNGEFIVAWSGEGPGDGRGIFARRLTSAGVVNGIEVLVNESSAGDQITPSVTADPVTDGFVVVWSHQIAGNDYDIRLRQFDAGNVPLGGAITVNQVTDNRQWNPTVVRRGDSLITCWSGHGDGDIAGVFTRTISYAEGES